MKLSINETSAFLFNKLFNEDYFDVFPKLKEYYEEDSDTMYAIFNSFLEELYDLSKPIAKPLLDERYTYVYRKVCGVLDDGFTNSLVSVGNELGITDVRVGQLIKRCNRILINVFVKDYENIKNGVFNNDLLIEQLDISTISYYKLKRQGINYLNEIDFELLKGVKGFGKVTFDDIEKGITKIRIR